MSHDAHQTPPSARSHDLTRSPGDDHLPVADDVDPDALLTQDIPSIRGALRRYQVMAWIVGILLVVLVCVGMPLKYLADNDSVVTWTGVPHGWLYMLLLITAVDLGRRVRWPWGRLALIGLAGTVPFFSFVAERSATKDVKQRLAAAVDVSPDELNGV